MACEISRNQDAADNNTYMPAAVHWSISEFSDINESLPSTKTPQEDLVSVLALAQRLSFNFLPITWQQGLGLLGRGNTADVSHSVVNTRTRFAFKRIRPRSNALDAVQRSLRALVNELKTLGAPGLRGHPGIIECEGICFERKHGFSDLFPVLVFPRATYGTLKQLMGTDEGMRASMEERIQMCITMAAAIKQLHEFDYVHGDVKPENFLVFDVDGKITPKIADLGYARNGFDTDTVTMAISRPWSLESRASDVTMYQAKRMDTYSFGMLCLWLLFLTPLGRIKPIMPTHSAKINNDKDFDSVMQTLQQWQSLGILLDKCHEIVQNQSDLTEENKIDLRKFFDLSLTSDLSLIDTSFKYLFGIGRGKDHHVEFKGWPGQHELSDLPNSHQILRVIPAMYQLATCGYHVRDAVFSGLQGRMNGMDKLHCCEDCEKQAAYELACCSFVGFGTIRDEKEALIWLQKAGRSKNDIFDELRVLHNQNMTDLFRDSLFQHLLADGQIYLADLAIDHDEQGEIENLERKLEQESRDIEQSLGATHGITLLLKLGIVTRACRRGFSDKTAKAIEMLHLLLAQTPRESVFLILRTLSYMAITLREQGKWHAAEELFQDVQKFLRSDGFPSDHPFSIGILANLASCQFKQDKLDEAEAGFKNALELSEKALSQQHPETLSSMANLGAVMREQGRLAEAEQLGRTAVATVQQILGYSHPTRIAIISSLASTLYARGNIGETEKYLNQLKNISFSNIELPDPETILILSRLAHIFAEVGRLKEAESLARQVLDKYEEVLGMNHPILIQIILNLSTVLWECGRFAESDRLEGRLSENISAIETPGHSYVLSFMQHRASTLKRKGHLSEAETIEKELVVIQTRKLGKDHPDTLRVRANLAVTLHEKERFQEAQEMAEDVVNRSCNILGPEHPDTLRRQLDRIYMIRDNGDAKSACQLEKDILKACRQTLGDGHPITLHARGNLAMTQWRLGEYQEAADTETEILKLYQERLGENHPHTVLAKARLGSSLSNLDRAAEAECLLSDVFTTYEAEWGRRDRRTLTIMSEVAIANAKLAQFDKAAKLMKEVVQARIEILGRSHSSTVRAATNLAEILDLLQEAQGAESVTNQHLGRPAVAQELPHHTSGESIR